MVSQRSRKLPTVISVLPILILALGLACGTSAPQATVAPAEAQPAAPAPAADVQPATPTPLPQAVIAPAGGGAEGPQYAPSFAEFWKPTTEFEPSRCVPLTAPFIGAKSLPFAGRMKTFRPI